MIYHHLNDSSTTIHLVLTASPYYSPASDMEFDPSEDPSSDHIPPLQTLFPFLSLRTLTSLDQCYTLIKLSPTHGTPFTKTTLSTQSTPVASGALRLDYYRQSSVHSLRSLVPSIHRSSAGISDRPYHDSSSASPSCKRSRSHALSVLLSLPILGALSYARADLLPSPKRIRSTKTTMDLKGCSKDSFEPYVPREAGLGVDFEDESSEPSRYRGTDLEMDVDVVRSDGIDIDPEIQAKIDECIAYADALRDRGIDARVVVEAIDREDIETDVRGPDEVRFDRVIHPVVVDDIPEPAQEGAVEVTYETLRDLVQRFHDHTEEILVRRVQLERDNMRLRYMMDVTSQIVARSQRRELRVQREMRQIWNLEPLMRDGGEQEDISGNGVSGNGVNGNGRNGNGGNGNKGNGNVWYILYHNTGSILRFG
ncbi:hypothetical protein Tco_1286289 [Tanacetum coccineum]